MFYFDSSNQLQPGITVRLLARKMLLALLKPSVLLLSPGLLVNVSPASKATVRFATISTNVPRELLFAILTPPAKTPLVPTLVGARRDTPETERPVPVCIFVTLF